jgi:hypothetical protein
MIAAGGLVILSLWQDDNQNRIYMAIAKIGIAALENFISIFFTESQLFPVAPLPKYL